LHYSEIAGFEKTSWYTSTHSADRS